MTSRQRAATLPQTPSLSDTAVWQAFDVEAWQGLLLPARTDARIAERLARETAAVLAEPELVRKLAEAGFKPMVMEQAQFTAHLQREKAAGGHRAGRPPARHRLTRPGPARRCLRCYCRAPGETNERPAICTRVRPRVNG